MRLRPQGLHVHKHNRLRDTIWTLHNRNRKKKGGGGKFNKYKGINKTLEEDWVRRVSLSAGTPSISLLPV